VILIDADVILLDLRYQSDPRFPVNQDFLRQAKLAQRPLAITSQALLEVVGVLSFNVSRPRIASLPGLICVHYEMEVIPDPEQHTDYASCTFAEVVLQMAQQMSAGDAVQAVQIENFAPSAECLLTWNAKHFAGKISIPVLTPADWLTQNLSSP
jgi:hypothetical protein